MKQMTKEEFSKYFNENFRLKLEELEKKRLFYAPIRKFCLIFALIAFVSMIIFGYIFGGKDISQTFSLMCFALIFLSLIVVGAIESLFRKPLKTKVISKIIGLYGNLYLTNQRNLIKLSDIRKFGLFPRAAKKIDDDAIIGNYKNTNIIINECTLEHTVRSGRNSHTVTDFAGLIVKLTMNKKFSGITVVGMTGDIKLPAGCENVELESVEFMKNRKVYSTDQIEARYLLTPTFMERLDNLGKHFMGSMVQNNATNGAFATDNQESIQKLKSSNSIISNVLSSTLDRVSGVSAIFSDGDIYLFIPLSFDFFEVSLDKSLLDSAQYYAIYMQLNSILEIIEYFKLDQKLGL